MHTSDLQAPLCLYLIILHIQYIIVSAESMILNLYLSILHIYTFLFLNVFQIFDCAFFENKTKFGLRTDVLISPFLFHPFSSCLYLFFSLFFLSPVDLLSSLFSPLLSTSLSYPFSPQSIQSARLSFQSSILGSTQSHTLTSKGVLLLPPLCQRGETHSLAGEGLGGDPILTKG